MNSKERFNRCLSFQSVDHAPLIEIAVWDQTVGRWYAEGLPREVDPRLLLVGGNKYFGLEGIDVVGIDLLPPYPKKKTTVLSEDERYMVFSDEFGRIRKALKTGVSMDHYEDFPIKSREDFNRYKAGYAPETIEARYSADWEAVKAAALRSESLLSLMDPLMGAIGFYSMLRNFMGTEGLSYMFHDDPALVEECLEMLSDYAELGLRKALDEIPFDFYMIHEDMCYNAGPLVSPELFRKVFLPRYVRFIDFLKSHGVKHIMIDTDGNYLQLLPLYLEAGIDSVSPNECAAGLDVVELRKRYPKLGLMGGIDKRALAKGEDAIRRELEYKIGGIIDKGGYIPTIDHSVPPDVSLQNFEFYLDLKRRLVCGG